MHDYEKLREHVGHIGLHIDKNTDGVIEIRCFARCHGGKDILLLTVEPPDKLTALCGECDSEILPSQYCMMGHWCGDRPAAVNICSHGVNLDNQACSICQPEEFEGSRPAGDKWDNFEDD